MMRAPGWCLAVSLAAVVAPACDGDPFERMIDQARLDTWEPSVHFEDGIGTRPPPDGTVPRDQEILTGAVEQGLSPGGLPVSSVPISIDVDDLAFGLERYHVLCSPCHGIAGDSNTAVARDMVLRRPPSLVDEPVRSHPPGRIYRAMVDGYGLMPSYASRLPIRDRWRVVAFVEALQLSQRAQLEQLPPEMRRKFRDATEGHRR